MQLGHLPLREVARAGPCLGLVAHDGTHKPEQRTLRREDLHHARAALDFPVCALLHVVGAQALPVRRREVQVVERVGLRLLERPCRPRPATPSGISNAAWYMATAVAASPARKTDERMRPTRRLSCQELASRMQSRIRCTAHRCQAAPWKTSPMALTRSPWASDTTPCPPPIRRAPASSRTRRSLLP